MRATVDSIHDVPKPKILKKMLEIVSNEVLPRYLFMTC